jgi:hypothetical protein
MVNDIEPNLGSPTPHFLYDYPASCGALARLKPKNELLAERFELYIAGIELCNGFSELTDPVEQKARFEKEQRRRKSLGQPVYPMPQKFLRALQDMPEAGGNALGIDRLVMLFCDTVEIDDVNEKLQMKIPDTREYDTFSGFVLDKIGRIPREKEEIHFENFIVTVKEMEGTRIKEYIVKKKENAPRGAEEAL